MEALELYDSPETIFNFKMNELEEDVKSFDEILEANKDVLERLKEKGD